MAARKSAEAIGRWRWLVAVIVLVVLSVGGWMSYTIRRTGSLTEAARRAAAERRWEDVERTTSELMQGGAAEPEWLRLRVRAALERKDVPTAIAVLGRVPETDPEWERAQMTRGRLLMEAFRYREAGAAFQRVVARNPALAEARIQLIILSGLKRDYGRFERELWEFWADCGQPLSALRMLARGVALLPDRVTLDQALDEGFLLRQGIEADPQDLALRPAFIRYLRDRGRIDEAVKQAEAWIEQVPSDVPTRVEWVGCQLELGVLESAVPFVDPVPADAGELGRFWTMRGDVLSRQGRFPDAVEAFRRAFALQPRDPECMYRLGMALKGRGEAGDEEESRTALEWTARANSLKALVLQIPEASPATEQLVRAGRLCLELKRTREAQGWLTLAMRQAPEDPGALALRADLATSQSTGAK